MSDPQQLRRSHHARHKVCLPIRSELRRRKLRRNSNSSSSIKDLATSSFHPSSEIPCLRPGSSKSSLAPSTSSSMVPKYMENLYVHRRSSLENRTSAALAASFTSTSDINAFCFRIGKSPNFSNSYMTISKSSKPKKCDDFLDSWDIRKGRQEVIRLQPKCGVVIQNIYLLEAMDPPRRPSLTPLPSQYARPFVEGSAGRQRKRQPSKIQKPSDADVIFGNSILFKDDDSSRWSISNIQWLLDLEALHEEPDHDAFHYREYEDICCLPFATNLLFFKTSY